MLRLRAPAKINLFLRVVGKRPDGFHELETLFERIDLADELTFEPHPADLTLTCDAPTLSCGEDNLVIKAARLLKRETGTTAGATMRLAKRIPIAAGLGGGSSDAATTLIGLSRLWQLTVPEERLLALGASLGSDVPFFLYKVPLAVGRGRGERCQPVASTMALSHVLVIPDDRLATKEIYAGSRFNLTIPRPSITIVEHALRNGSLSELAQAIWNDLEPEAIRRCPAIETIQSRLRALGCLGVRLSGSGPSVFGLCRDRAHADDIAAKLRASSPASWRIETVHTQHASGAAMTA